MASARNCGFSVTRGRIVAQIDADCTAVPDWVERIVRAHETGYQAVGGAVANRNPSTPVAWGAYFCEFSQWMPGGAQRRMNDIPGANISYRRELLEQYGPFLAGTYSSDTAFHWRLAEAGIPLLFDPKICVYHKSIDSLRRLIKHEREHGRFFAQVRTKIQKFTIMKQILHALCFPLRVAAILFVRTLQNCLNQVYRKHFIRSFPYLVIGVLVWALGETEGYICGRKQEIRINGNKCNIMNL